MNYCTELKKVQPNYYLETSRRAFEDYIKPYHIPLKRHLGYMHQNLMK